ncbi:hypothetical protein Hanom_Chr10g00878531 [Helianthus anomalus]
MQIRLRERNGGRTNVYRGIPGGTFHLLGYMTDIQTIVYDDCIRMKYEESPTKIRCLDRTCFKFSVCFYTRFCFLVVAGITYTFFIERVTGLIKKLNKSGTHGELWGPQKGMYLLS